MTDYRESLVSSTDPGVVVAGHYKSTDPQNFGWITTSKAERVDTAKPNDVRLLTEAQSDWVRRWEESPKLTVEDQKGIRATISAYDKQISDAQGLYGEKLDELRKLVQRPMSNQDLSAFQVDLEGRLYESPYFKSLFKEEDRSKLVGLMAARNTVGTRINELTLRRLEYETKLNSAWPTPPVKSDKEARKILFKRAMAEAIAEGEEGLAVAKGKHQELRFLGKSADEYIAELEASLDPSSGQFDFNVDAMIEKTKNLKNFWHQIYDLDPPSIVREIYGEAGLKAPKMKEILIKDAYGKPTDVNYIPLTQELKDHFFRNKGLPID